jgi:hypothetical protein
MYNGKISNNKLKNKENSFPGSRGSQAVNMGIYNPNNNSSPAARGGPVVNNMYVPDPTVAVPVSRKISNNNSFLANRGGPVVNNMHVSDPTVAVSVSRKIPKYAFGNYADPNFFQKREEFRNNPNYIAYKKKIKDYANGKNLQKLYKEFSDNTIKKFLEKNYNNVENNNVIRAFDAMKTYKKHNVNSYKMHKEMYYHNLQTSPLEKDDIKSEREKELLNKVKKISGKNFKTRKELLEYTWKPKKFFVAKQKENEKNKRKQRKQYPKKFLMASTEEELNAIESTMDELIAFIYWVEFIKFYKNIEDYNSNNEEINYNSKQQLISYRKNNIRTEIKKLFPDISEEEIDESYKYIYEYFNNPTSAGVARDNKFKILKKFVEKIKKRKSLKEFKNY